VESLLIAGYMFDKNLKTTLVFFKTYFINCLISCWLHVVIVPSQQYIYY